MRDRLNEIDLATLDFERRWSKYPGAKETAIRDLFDESPTRYHQRVPALIERPTALEHDPMLVRRLRRQRDARRRQRSARGVLTCQHS